MYSRYLVVFGVVQLLLIIHLESASCFKVQDSMKKPQLESSGWRTIDISSIKTPDEQDQSHQKDSNNVRMNSLFVVKNKKLIEWDDDDNSSGSSSLVIPYEDSNIPKVVSKLVETTTNPDLNAPKKWSKKAGKLIYHGQLKENGTSRVVDGVVLHINTHKPLKISRNRYQTFGSPLEASSSSSRIISDLENTDEISFRALGELKTKSNAKTKINNSNRQVDQSLDVTSVHSASSDWRPIVINSRPRRADKMKARGESVNESGSNKSLNENHDSRWRPLASKHRENIYTVNPDSSSESPKRQKAIKSTMVSSSSIEEPFEDDGYQRESFTPEPVQIRAREPKSMNTTLKMHSNKWKPVDTTTVTPVYDLVDSPTTTLPSTTSLQPATPIIGTLNGNHSESAQRSASDLNYIYSSQQAVQQQPTDWLSTSTSRQSSGYYPSASYSASYGLQQPSTEQQQPSFPQTAIIDTVSGQNPEMIEPRMPDTAVLPMSEYSLPHSSATFQPAQAPPIRQQQMQAAYSYDTYGSSRIPARQQVALAPAPTVSPNQFVRQEHHYHYYNQHQQQQLPERQLQPSSVIREIQPLLISQPIIQQQQPSSTSSPPPAQIIREIIKEIPMPIPQVPRIIIPAPPPPPPPSAHSIHLTQGTREADSGLYSYAAPAHRIMRQISNSIPVAMSMRQIRLPMPTIQLPVRLAPSNPAPVTRQTGSYVIPPMPQKTTTYLTETQAMPTHTTIMHTTQFTPATRTTVYTTDHQPNPQPLTQTSAYKR